MRKMIIKLSSNKKLAGNTIIYTVSSLINKIIPFVLLTIITRYLTTEEYGIASMIAVSCQVIAPFIMMGVSAAFIRKFIEEGEEDNRIYLFNGILVMTVLSVFVSVLLILFHSSLEKLTAIPNEFITSVITISISNVFYDTGLAVIEAKEKPKEYLFLQVGFSLLNAVLSIWLVVWLHLGLRGYVISLSVVGVLKLIISIWSMIKEIGIIISIQKKYIRDIVLSFGIPMIPTQLKGTVLTYSDRLFITNMVALSATGVYSVGSQFAQPIEVLCQSFNLAFVPWLYKKLNTGDNETKKKIVKLTYLYDLAFLFGSIVWALIARFMLQFWVGEDFAEGGLYIMLLSIGFAFHAMQMMVVNYIYYVKKVNLYSFVTMIILSLNLLLDYVFINKNGTIGAAQATMVVNILSFVFTWGLAAYVYKMPWFSFLSRKKDTVRKSEENENALLDRNQSKTTEEEL